MAGTDKQLIMTSMNIALAPAVILVRPQLGENIGMCARAMLNCGVTELRLVTPRDGWPNPDAVAAASGAVSVLENAKVFSSLKEAVADLEYVFATTARGREMVKDIYTVEAAAQEVHVRNSVGGRQKCGVLFGPERAGLENDDVAMANAILHIPLNPGFSSLNLAQAVLLVSHAWLSAGNVFSLPAVVPSLGDTAPAQKEEIEILMTHLEGALEKGGFFRSPEQRPTLMRNIRNFFFRSTPTQQDIRTLHGVLACLTGKKSSK
jgi:tRNA/rRNA methyltransferase